MIINKSGITIRLAIKDLRVLGRVTQGVRLINISDKDEIASVAKIDVIEGEEDEVLNEEGAENIIVSNEATDIIADETTETSMDEPTE
jgi:DNA gyrase subunit A